MGEKSFLLHDHFSHLCWTFIEELDKSESCRPGEVGCTQTFTGVHIEVLVISILLNELLREDQRKKRENIIN